jgi:hypothetical protein
MNNLKKFSYFQNIFILKNELNFEKYFELS